MITWNNLWTHVAAAEQKQLWQCLRLDWKHPTDPPPNVWAKRFQRTLWIVRCQAPPAFDSEQSWCWNKRTLTMTMPLRCQSWYAWCSAACAQTHPQKQSIALPGEPFVVQCLQFGGLSNLRSCGCCRNRETGNWLRAFRGLTSFQSFPSVSWQRREDRAKPG